LNTPIRTATLAFLLLLSFGRLSMAQSESDLDSRKLWRSCSACHCVPDMRISEDKHWLKLNMITACIAAKTGTPEVRSALNRYLSAEKTARPILIDAKHAAPAKAICGNVRFPTTAGSAYLRADSKSIQGGSPTELRLRWNAYEKGAVLAIPIGDYRVIGYNFYRSDKAKKRWVLSGTAAGGCVSLSVRKTATASFDLDPKIYAHLSCKKVEKGFAFNFVMGNRGGTRISLACDGDLLAPRWTVSRTGGGESDKKTLDQGAFVVS